MSNYIPPNIDLLDLTSQRGESKEKTFELLCSDFMKIKFDLDRVPLPSQNDSFPGIEGEPVDKEGLYYHCQAKFGVDAFTRQRGFESSLLTINTNLNANTYKLDVLCLISKEEFPTSNRDSRNKVFSDFETNNNLKIEKFFGNDFISELGKIEYLELLHKYFPIDIIKEKVYSECYDENDVCDILLNSEIENVKNGFEGKKSDYSVDLKRAKLIQEKYTYKKLAYSTKPWLLENFEELENSIADEIFDELTFGDYKSLNDYIKNGIDLLGDTNSIKKYDTELGSLIHGKRGLFVNYGTQGKSCLNYIESNKIEFKDKRNENSI